MNGTPVPTNGVAVATAQCPSGYTVVSGGYTPQPNSYAGLGEKGHPINNNTGWEVPTTLDNTPGATITAWAICLPVG
ncbi:hypothetical protein [Actinomadura logoneensis]|uniref:hypothetical protein n=1 Tax=Actinomadura logoneensis TaxID=2293572 RepID=UPI001F2E2469|nr:hypothetical protein [Actinomadura logoneensis]